MKGTTSPTAVNDRIERNFMIKERLGEGVVENVRERKDLVREEEGGASYTLSWRITTESET